LSAGQIGVSLLRTVFQGVHVGTTVKYIRGTLRAGEGVEGTSGISDLLDQGESLEGGDAGNEFDLDLGVLAITGPLRIGGVVKNLFEPEFEAAGAAARMTLPRQARLGVAFDAVEAGGPPLTVALDADLAAYTTGMGERRMVAIGAEQWLFDSRVGLRGGVRVNTTGDKGTTATVGASVAIRAGLYLDGHFAGGGSAGDNGWGAAGRVSF
jgi:hypothetical protein